MADEPVNPIKKLNIKDAAYVPHPVAPGVKREFNRAGYAIVDAQFAPEGYALPAKLQTLLDKLTPKSQQPALQPLTPAGATRTPKPAAPPAAPAASTAPAPGSEGNDMLYGSSTLQSVYVIGDQEVQLGTIVAAAHTASGKTVEEWNALSEVDRDVLLNAELEKFREAALQAEKNKSTKDVKDMSDAELRDAIVAAGGVKPAWNAKRENLEAAYAAATIPK